MPSKPSAPTNANGMIRPLAGLDRSTTPFWRSAGSTRPSMTMTQTNDPANAPYVWPKDSTEGKVERRIRAANYPQPDADQFEVFMRIQMELAIDNPRQLGMISGIGTENESVLLISRKT